MAKNDSKGQGSGVTFTPNASYAGPYNYTRADVPIYAPGTGYNQTLPTPPGEPPAAPPAAPGKKPRTPRTPRAGGGGGGAGRAMGGGSGRVGGGMAKGLGPSPHMAKGLGPSPHNAFTGNGQNAAYLKNGGRPRNSFDYSSSLHQRGELPRIAVNQTGMGMALGGAGRGLNAMPRVQPPMPTPAPGSIQNPIARYPAGTTPPGMPKMPRNQPPVQGITVPSTGGGGMPTSVPRSAPAIIGNANPGTGMPGRSGMAPPRTGTLPNGRQFPGQGVAGNTPANPNRNPMGQQQRMNLANALARPTR